MRLLLLALLGLSSLSVDVSDTVAVSDTLLLTIERSPFDSVSVADTSTLQVEYDRNLFDTIAVSDRVSFVYSKDTLDTIAVSDAIAFEYDVAKTDLVSITDASSVAKDSSTFVIDSAFVSDICALEYTLGIRDTLSLMEEARIGAEFSRTLTDEDITTDATSRSVELGLHDTIAVTDTFLTNASYSRTVGDLNTPISDAVTISQDLNSYIADSVSVVDLVTAGFDRLVTSDDTINVIDSLVRADDLIRYLFDQIDLSDTTTRISDSIRDFSDFASAEDLLTVSVDDQTDRLQGEPGNFDFYMPVCNGDHIVFVATLPGVMTKNGVRFTNRVRYAALRRAASTLAHWGVRNGCIIEFMRKAIPFLQEELAALLGVSEATVQAWESDQLEMPRLMFDSLAACVCAIDERSYGANFEIIEPPSDEQVRVYRIVPAIPNSNKILIHVWSVR